MSYILIGSSQISAGQMLFENLTFIKDCAESREGYHHRDVINANQTVHTTKLKAPSMQI